MAGGMEAEDYLGARGAFDAQALGADGHTAVGADLEGGAETPNIRFIWKVCAFYRKG